MLSDYLGTPFCKVPLMSRAHFSVFAYLFLFLMEMHSHSLCIMDMCAVRIFFHSLVHLSIPLETPLKKISSEFQ